MVTLPMEPIMVCNTTNMLGECVIWDHRTQMLQWTDIESSLFWQWDMTDRAAVCHALPERLGSFALTDDPNVYMGAFESGFARFSVQPPHFEMLAPITQDFPHLRMNDGRVDRGGHFWAGAMAEKAGSPLGSLWRYNGGGEASAFLHDIRIPNSLCWSGNGKIMYFADSPGLKIWAYDFDDEVGPIGEPRLFAETPKGIHADGSCIDADDHLWNAQWGGGHIIRYRPDGNIDQRIILPVTQPTCVTFAGRNLDLLCVTSARVNLSDEALLQQPLAGSILVYQLSEKGREENICIWP